MAGSAIGTSTSAVVSSLAFNGVIFGGFVLGFLLLRIKFRRIYQPKSAYDLVPPEKKPEPLPRGVYKWIWILLSKPHSFIIQQAGLDGYFFLRYLLVMACVCLAGLLLYPILLPINIANGKNEEGFDKLSISNVKHEKRYYAHAILSWVFYGFIFFVIYRELFFYASLRQAVLSSPKYAKKLSSRVVLFQTVPKQYLHEREFFKLFTGVKKVWVTRSVRRLRVKVAKRTAISNQLELLENKLLHKAMKAKLKFDKKGITIEREDDIDLYVPQNKRPKTRLKSIFGKKVDAINHLKEQLPRLNKQIAHLQKHYRKTKQMNSIFVEFNSQYDAEIACQVTTHHLPYHMGPSYTGIEPGDVLWPNMRVLWFERLLRESAAICCIVAIVCLWAVPVAFVGVISNITYLTNKIHFLRFILNLPSALRGIVTSLFPSILLNLLSMVLPMLLRGIARISGCVTVQQVEYFTQNAYFAYLVINVFLITTIASSAASTATEIIKDPSSAMSILASGLPKSSNFFISYLLLQGIGIAGGALFQIVAFIMFYVLGFLIDKSVRRKYDRFNNLSTYAWGTTFPTYTNLAVITISFSIISPLIIVFAFASFAILYIAYLHNITYVFGESSDGRGMYYPRALFQTLTGIYIGEICLLGLFIVGKGWGPVVMEAILIGASIFAHYQLNAAFGSLINVVPIDCMRPLDGVSDTPSYYNPDRTDLQEGSPYYDKESSDFQNSDMLGNDYIPLLADGDQIQEPPKSNFFMRFLRPDIYSSYKFTKRMLPATYQVDPVQNEQVDKHAYDYPVVSDPPPVIWIPKDPMGWSTKEIEKFKGVAPLTDANSEFNEKGEIRWKGGCPGLGDLDFKLDLSNIPENAKEKKKEEEKRERYQKNKTKAQAKADKAHVHELRKESKYEHDSEAQV